MGSLPGKARRFEDSSRHRRLEAAGKVPPSCHQHSGAGQGPRRAAWQPPGRPTCKGHPVQRRQRAALRPALGGGSGLLAQPLWFVGHKEAHGRVLRAGGWWDGALVAGVFVFVFVLGRDATAGQRAGQRGCSTLETFMHAAPGQSMQVGAGEPVEAAGAAGRCASLAGGPSRGGERHAKLEPQAPPARACRRLSPHQV